jgi:hypothetical protein
MTAHLEKLKRIARLQKRLHELSSWRLGVLNRRCDDLAGDRFEMLEALGDGWMAFGAPAAAGTRRVRALEVDLAAARADCDARAAEAREQGARLRQSERAVAAAAARCRAATERRDLAASIEGTLHRRPSVPRKP